MEKIDHKNVPFVSKETEPSKTIAVNEDWEYAYKRCAFCWKLVKANWDTIKVTQCPECAETQRVLRENGG